MNQGWYNRKQVLLRFQIDERFLSALEDELLVRSETSASGPIYSFQTCERIRVASELVHELDVNLAGAAIIVRMREQLEAMQKQFYETLDLIREAATSAERRRTRR